MTRPEREAAVSAAKPVVRLSGLTAAFKTDGAWTEVVRDVDFDIGPRETVAVVGESGSGKSVTALSIMRLLPEVNSRVHGRIEFEGTNLPDLSEDEMRRIRGNAISMIFQEPMTSLNPLMTVGSQVAEALRYHRGMDRREAERAALELFDHVRIPDARSRFHDYPHLFSGGMRQRVMIAMALACRPRLLIADEPTTALDVTIQAQILDLIQMLQDELGMSVMFITHDLGVVAEIADRVVVMWRGEKVEEGTVSRIFDDPRHPYTRKLLSAVPRLGSMQGLPAPAKFPDVEADAGGSDEVPVPSGREAGAAPATEPLLEVSGLTTRFPVHSGLLRRISAQVHAVENVSFGLARGETLALVGESGCGKSTTGRSILRLIEPTRGVVRFDGDDVATLNKPGLQQVRQHMQMIFQDPFASLNPRKLVGAAIAEPMQVHGVASGSELEDRVVGLLRKVGLEPEHGMRYPHEFSGGQRQRLCIARALGLGPKMIVADEVVSALDVSIKAQVINLMMDLQQELGLAYLFISHDIAVVERMSHRVAVMYLGEIVEIGPRQAVFENPSHPYTRKLMAAVPVPDPTRRRRELRLATDELPNPLRPVGFEPRPKPFLEIGPGHFVQQHDAAGSV